MRVNVYNEELTSEVEIAHVEPAPGRNYIGLRFMLESADKLHHTEGDDDRSAVTLWVGSHRAAYDLLSQARAALAHDEMSMIRGEVGQKRDPGYPYGDMDASHWAEEFERIFGKSLAGYPSKDTMLGWFANALMTGFDRAKNDRAEIGRALDTQADEIGRLLDIISEALTIAQELPLPSPGISNRQRVIETLQRARPHAPEVSTHAQAQRIAQEILATSAEGQFTENAPTNDAAAEPWPGPSAQVRQMGRAFDGGRLTLTEFGDEVRVEIEFRRD